MARKKRKLRLSATERARRRKQAIKNFGKKRTVKRKSLNRTVKRSNNMARRRRSTRRTTSRRSVKRSSRRKSTSIMGFDIEKLALMGAGSGLAGVGGSLVNNLSGGRLSGNVAQLGGAVVVKVAGKSLGVSKFTNKMSDGMIIKTVGDFVEDNVAPQVASAIGGIGGVSNDTGKSANGIEVV